MPSKVVTIGYLKTFVSGILSVSTAYNDDRYCPTYAELTGGSLVTNYKSDTNPTKTTNGIRINGCSVGTSYSSNQLVVEPDLELLYQQLQSISVSAAKTTVSCCATSTTLSSTAYFKLVTKTTGGTSTASTSTSASVSASYSEDESFTSINGNTISFTKNTVNTSNCTGAPARSSIATGSYTYSGSTKTNTVTITQSANNIDTYWTNTSTSTYDVSIYPTSMSFDSAGGTKSYTVTRHYTQYQEKYDDCGTAVCFNSYNTSTTVTPSSASASGDFTCTKSNVSIGVNSGSARSGTLTVSYGGYNATCSLSQGASQAGTTNGEPYNYDYYLSVSTPSGKISCDGGSATFTARYVTTWDYDWETKNDAGEVTNSGTSSDSSSTNVTNSAEWSTTVGSVSKGTLTLGAYDEDTRRTATVTAKYNGYSDSDYVYQESCKPASPCDCDTQTTINADVVLSVSMMGVLNGQYTYTTVATATLDKPVECGDAYITVYYGVGSYDNAATETITISEGNNNGSTGTQRTTSKEDDNCIYALRDGHSLTFDNTDCYKAGNINVTVASDCYCSGNEPEAPTVTSTTYSYSAVAQDFGECDTSTTAKVYATPTYHYSDGTSSSGTKSEISVAKTLTYRISSTETYKSDCPTNPNSYSRTVTINVEFRHNGSQQSVVTTATQDAGPCNTGSTCVIGETITSNGGNATKVTVGKGGTKTLTIYTKEDGMFSMVSVEPDTYDSDLVTISNTASSQTEYHTTWVLTASNSKTGSTNITFKNGCGEYVVPFEVTAATPTSCTCSVTSISVNPSAYTFTSRSEKKDFTVTISNNGCDKCQGYFLYNPDGIYMGPGTNNAPFTLYGSSQSGNYKVVAMDNTGITKTVKVVADIPEDPVYVMQKTSADTSTSITFPGGTTHISGPGYICCYSTKDGVKQSVTASSDSAWLTVSENNDLPYDGANYNFKFNQTENTSTSSRTGKITITQSGSNKKVVWTIVQAGKPECSCSVTSISVSPSTYEFSSSTENKSFTVTINDNGCNKCNGGFKVYNSSGTYVTSGTSSFTLSNQTGTFTIKANDNTGKTCTLSTTKYTAPTVYQYTFKNCYSNRQIGLFASNATPSGSDTKYAMLAALDGTAAIVLVTSNNGTPVNNSSNSMSTTAKIGDSVKVYSVQGQSWKLEETITLTASNRSFEYGDCNSKTCNPLFMSYDDSTHKMTATFEEMVASDVTIYFSVKVNNSTVVSDNIKISEGNNTNSKTLSTSQAITSTAGTSVVISSISPSSDSEYEYNCDTDWEIIPSSSQTDPCVNATVKLGSSNTWGDSDLNSQVVHKICPGNCNVSASGNFYYGYGYMGHNHTFDIDFSIEKVGAIIQTIECSTDSGNHSGEGSFGFTYSGINPDLLFQDGGVMTISGTYTFLDGTGNRQTGTYSVTITIIEI